MIRLLTKILNDVKENLRLISFGKGKIDMKRIILLILCCIIVISTTSCKRVEDRNKNEESKKKVTVEEEDPSKSLDEATEELENIDEKLRSDLSDDLYTIMYQLMINDSWPARSFDLVNACLMGYTNGEVNGSLPQNGRIIFVEVKYNGLEELESDELTMKNLFYYAYEEEGEKISNIEFLSFQMDFSKTEGISDKDIIGDYANNSLDSDVYTYIVSGAPYININSEYIDDLLEPYTKSLNLCQKYHEDVFLPEYYEEKQEESIEKEEKENRSNREPEIGMTKEEVLEGLWGTPDYKNVDKYEWGTEEQWVYEGKGYVYFEDGIVTAIQYRN